MKTNWFCYVRKCNNRNHIFINQIRYCQTSIEFYYIAYVTDTDSQKS
eukprot:UN27826